MRREWVPRKKNTINTRKTQNEHFLGKCTFECLTLPMQCFFSKRYQEIVVFHKHELTMAGTTETERHGTRMGTEKKKHEKHKKDIERTFFGKMYFRMSEVADTMFFSAKSINQHLPNDL